MQDHFRKKFYGGAWEPILAIRRFPLCFFLGLLMLLRQNMHMQLQPTPEKESNTLAFVTSVSFKGNLQKLIASKQ